MAVVAVAFLGVEVVGADDGGVCYHLTASSHTQVTHVVRYRTAQATHQSTCKTQQGGCKVRASDRVSLHCEIAVTNMPPVQKCP